MKNSPSNLPSYDPERAAKRLEGALERAGVTSAEDAAAVEAGLRESAANGERPDKAGRGYERAVRRAVADVVQPMTEAERLGAALPPVRALLKTGWRVEQVDVPEGDEFVEARPAYVVRFEGSAPIERLRRAGVLDDGQVSAAAKVCALYLAAVKPPKLTAAYDIVTSQGGKTPRPWVEVGSDAWKRLNEGLSALLPVEAEIVMEVCVYETTIEALASRGLVRFKSAHRAGGAVVQSLSCGLTRLAQHWGLVSGYPQNVPT